MSENSAIKKSNTAPPFPALKWWQEALRNKSILINEDMLYNKSNPQNRYYLTGAQGIQILTIPIKGGRNQRKKIKEVLISYDSDWQGHHWKTIKTLYERSPFFEYFEAQISTLFEDKIANLLDWNKKSILLMNQLAQLNLKFTTKKSQEPDFNQPLKEIKYHQVFEDKVGFQPNCSILDLLFCEGNNTFQKLNN